MKKLQNGISFIIRIKNEEKTLESCLQSLRSLKLDHEIIIISNQCTDNSIEIINQEKKINSKIKLYEHNFDISRAGYETLCTDAKSKHSLTYLWNLGAELSNYYWRFDWDGDFFMTDSIRQYIEEKNWVRSNTPSGVKFYAVDNDGVMHSQEYLFSHHFYADKYWFWHVKKTLVPYSFEDPQYAIWHLSSLKNMKSYWQETPWFLNCKSQEAEQIKRRWLAVQEMLGPEIIGQARASNRESIDLLTNAINKQSDIIGLGIDPSGGWLK